jgi:hypothetical protein
MLALPVLFLCYLRAIIEYCNRFLRPLSQNYPYPIFHTPAAITKEFCTRMRTPAMATWDIRSKIEPKGRLDQVLFLVSYSSAR